MRKPDRGFQQLSSDVANLSADRVGLMHCIQVEAARRELKARYVAVFAACVEVELDCFDDDAAGFATAPVFSVPFEAAVQTHDRTALVAMQRDERLIVATAFPAGADCRGAAHAAPR